MLLQERIYIDCNWWRKMKKVALVYIGNIEICPYMKAYQEILEEKGINYDVIFWEREELCKNYPDNYIIFRFLSDPAKNKKDKIVDFLKYFCWLKRVLKTKYEKIVFLDTLSAFLAFIGGNLKNVKYSIEIRDYTYENILIFKEIESKMLKKADKVFISSEAFKNFLPNQIKYIQTHNLNVNESQLEKNNLKKNININKQKYKVVYVGSLKYFDCQKSIVTELANNNRFEIQYHGYGPDYNKFVDYCNKMEINNISITGLYTDDMKPDFYDGADFIINCYDKNEGSEVLYALSNKFYDGLIYHIPQIVEKGTFKGNLVSSLNIGIEWDSQIDSNLSNKIISFIKKMDVENFNYVCHKELNGFLKQYEEYILEIKDFLTEIV